MPRRRRKPVTQDPESESDPTKAVETKNRKRRSSNNKQEKARCSIGIETIEVDEEEEEEREEELVGLVSPKAKKTQQVTSNLDLSFVGQPIDASEAQNRWPIRYLSKKKMSSGMMTNSSKGVLNSTEENVLQASCHHRQAMLDGVVFNLGDDAYVKAEDSSPDYIARIVELFETVDKEPYFTAQWFYRAEDTVIKEKGHVKESKRVFLSEIKDDNPLNCIVSKVKIALVSPNLDLHAKEKQIPPCDLYYDMKYTLPYLTFATIKHGDCAPVGKDSNGSSTLSSETNSTINNGVRKESKTKAANDNSTSRPKMFLLDLYSGCGAMSTGLSLGASLSGVELVTRWAVDINPFACKSLKINHPETEVRNEAAEDFLSLLKEWEILCRRFRLYGSDANQEESSDSSDDEENEEGGADNNDGDDNNGEDNPDDSELSSEIFEVERFLAVCYGNPNEVGKRGLYFKVRWKGYEPSYDTWEPITGLSDCKERLKEFVIKGFRSNILPLPGKADVICGGPPCQGISGFNRFRNTKAPLDDPKNHQLVVFMDIVEYLKPKYVLMENVVDILKFLDGLLGRYALGRLVSMNYQARLGIMAAGAYGLPQFRLRFFLWGAHPSENLPQFSLPTHDVVARGGIPSRFEEIYVSYDKMERRKLENALYLKDAISDLPSVENDEKLDERKYGTNAQKEFQKYIRLKKEEMVGHHTAGKNGSGPHMLYDHRPLKLNADDYERVCRIPKRKGANFRDLPGVIVGPNNKVEWDPSIDRALVSSGKPLVPDYAMKFVNGTSSKPFGRLWWDETVATVVTRAEPHNQIILHPAQDRVLTIRENARLQGFPDNYKLFGPIKQRYIQVGNAVAVPVGLALGYSLGLACQGLSDDKPLTTLPFKFPNCLQATSIEELDSD